MPLNEKQQRFVAEYIIDLNGTQAAIRAGYSPKTAHVQGSRLLTHTKVAAAIAESMQARGERTQATSDWVLKRLHDEAEADMADLYDEAGRLKPIKEWPLVWRKGLVAGVEVEEFLVDGEPYSQVKKVKLSDRHKRTELIGKHVKVGAFSEKIEHSGTISLADLIAGSMQKPKDSE